MAPNRTTFGGIQMTHYRAILSWLSLLMMAVICTGCLYSHSPSVSFRRADSPPVSQCSSGTCDSGACSTDCGESCSSGRNCASADCCVTSDHVRVTMQCPTKVTNCQEIEVKLYAKALGDVAEVEVITYLPCNVEVIDASCPMDISHDRAVWKIDRMCRGDDRCATLVLRPHCDGKLVCGLTVSALPMATLPCCVGTPMLSICKTGPKSCVVGCPVTYDITVKNNGRAVAECVEIVDHVPPGLEHRSGQSKLRNRIGNLAPGDSKNLSICFTAIKGGLQCNRVTATSKNCGNASAECSTYIAEPQVAIRKTGPTAQFVNKMATYDIVVTNTGDTPLHHLVVTDLAPPATRVVEAPEGRVTGNRVVWMIDELSPSEEHGFKVTLQGIQDGVHCNQVAVRSREGAQAHGEFCTDWQGHAALLIEVVDTEDPLVVGGRTKYKVGVVNQGTASEKNVRLVAKFPAGVEPVHAYGDTQGTVAGHSVHFAPYPELHPKQSVTYFIDAKALAEGDQRLRVELHSDLLETPVVEEESTFVY